MKLGRAQDVEGSTGQRRPFRFDKADVGTCGPDFMFNHVLIGRAASAATAEEHDLRTSTMEMQYAGRGRNLVGKRASPGFQNLASHRVALGGVSHDLRRKLSH